MIVIDLWILHYHNTSEIFKSTECKSCIEKIKINSECCFTGLKSDRIICKCRECKKEWKESIKELTEEFPGICQYCNEILKKNFVIKKGVYPYEYMDSWEKLEENTLPPKEGFYSNLNLEDISDEDYMHDQKV